MSIIIKNLIQSRSQLLRTSTRHLSHFRGNGSQNHGKFYKLYLLLGTGGLCVGYFALKTFKINSNRIYALQQRKDEIAEKAVKLTAREKRFIKFASVEFDGQLYLTPQDFLESVVEQEPRPRLKRKRLSENEIDQLKSVTPSLRHGSSNLFRSLRDRGIISYTEYLFLLSVLTKPHSGFKIAFNMFDTDGNSKVDKNEFLVIRQLLGGTYKDREFDEDSKEAMEKIFSYAWRGKRGIEVEEGKEGEDDNDHLVDDEQGLQRRHKVDTTLQIHFFGKKGTQDLNFDGFYNFMKNLQSEVLELEFHEFSKGHDKISEVDFAKILLRYTYLDTEEYDNYLDRLLDRHDMKEKGVTFEEFKQFCQFLNNLEDFSIAMRMYTLADRSISKDEFSRAVKICTGYALSNHLIDTVFAIFDEDGDGLLSYKEFIAIMKDRLHRGFKVNNKYVMGNYLEEYDEDDFSFISLLRSRACRRIANYLIHSTRGY
ncbi:calcium uptake protein 3, mitochondrial isoform X3 [Chironomus tepperi]|uniref:calcium uptake protein 3, mitochondrial isoform X3 n=1 Tax=Chironomus tepperi TaxID=113505 RepID=UPI00391F1DDA